MGPLVGIAPKWHALVASDFSQAATREAQHPVSARSASYAGTGAGHGSLTGLLEFNQIVCAAKRLLPKQHVAGVLVSSQTPIRSARQVAATPSPPHAGIQVQ